MLHGRLLRQSPAFLRRTALGPCSTDWSHLEISVVQRPSVRLRGSYLALIAVALLSQSPAQTGPSAAPTAAGPISAASKSTAAPGAEVGMPLIHNYSTRDYEAGPQVWSVLEDKRGLIYVGSSSGAILEFDGVTWRKIFHASSTVRSLGMDESGRIWAGLEADFGYLAPDAAGSLQFVSLLDKVPAEYRDFTDVWQVLPTPKGVFFRSYQSLFRWDGQRMHVWAVRKDSRFQALSMVRGHIYTAENGVGLEEIVGDELRPAPGGDAYKNSVKLFLFPFDDNRIVVSERDGLLSFYDGQKVTPFKTEADAYLKKSRIYTSTILNDGSICITSLSGGVTIVGRDGKLLNIIDAAAGLQSSNVLSAYQDREGGLWIGSEAGVSRVEINSPVSIYARTPTYDAIRYKGSVYASTTSGGEAVSRLVAEPGTNRLSSSPIRGANQAWTLVDFNDPKNPASEQLLAGTNEGVLRVEGDSMVPAMPSTHGASEAALFIGRSTRDPSRILIGHTDGVGSMRWDGHAWIDEGRIPNLFYQCSDAAEDPDGSVWFSGGSGKILHVQVPPTGMRDAKYELIGKDQGLPAGPNDATLIGGQIFLTVQRSKNIYRWDPATHKFIVDNRFQLLVDAADANTFLNPTDDRHLWVFTSSSGTKRLGLFTRQADGSWHLEEDAYRSLTRLGVFIFRPDRDGATLITGEHLLRYTPQSQGAPPAPFPTVVRLVKSGSQIVFGGTKIADGAELRLPPGSSDLRFQFAALAYANPADTEYQYLLDGVDKGWSPWDKQKEANYSGLGPGNYRFRVRSRTDDGRAGDEDSFAFTILAPWYRTTTAYVIYVLLFLLAAIAGWALIGRYERKKARLKTEALEAQAKALEATVNERTQEIRAQASEIAAQKDSIELLSDIGKEITASLDLNTILFKLYERVNQIVDASIFGVGLYRPEKRQIEYSLAIENGKRYAPYTRSMDDKNQFAVWCIEHRQPILINDVALEYKKYISAFTNTVKPLDDGTIAQPPASMIYLPLIAQERVLGVLSMQSFKKNAYTEQHLSLLENLAAYTTIALDNANAYQVINQRELEVRERAAELVTINRISQALATQLDKDRLIQFVGDQVRDLFRAPIAYVSLLDRATMMLHFPYAYGEDAPPRPFGSGLTSQIIRTGQPLLINEDMEAQPRPARRGTDRPADCLVPRRAHFFRRPGHRRHQRAVHRSGRPLHRGRSAPALHHRHRRRRGLPQRTAL